MMTTINTLAITIAIKNWLDISDIKKLNKQISQKPIDSKYSEYR